MSYEDGHRKLIEIHLPLSIDEVPQQTVVTPVVKKFIGEKKQYWQQLAPEIKKPKGLVVELVL